jgi:YggT family protein
MIRALIQLYIFVLIIDVFLSFLPQVKNQPWAVAIRKAADLTCKPVRKVMPPDLPFDFSPLIVIMAFQLLQFLW